MRKVIVLYCIADAGYWLVLKPKIRVSLGVVHVH